MVDERAEQLRTRLLQSDVVRALLGQVERLRELSQEYNRLRNVVVSQVVLVTALLGGYMLLSVYKIGFTIVGVFPVVMVSGLWGLANASLFVAERVDKPRRWAFLAERFWLVLLAGGPALGGLAVLALPNWQSAVIAAVGATVGIDPGPLAHNGVLVAAVGLALAAVFWHYGQTLATVLIGAPTTAGGTDTLTDPVAELKRQHEAGEIDDGEFERKLEMLQKLGQATSGAPGETTHEGANPEEDTQPAESCSDR